MTVGGVVGVLVVEEQNCAAEDALEGAVPLAELARQLRFGAVELSARTAAWLQLVEEFDRRGGWEVPGMTSCAHWLSWQCGVAPGTARDHVRLARALRRLPRLAEEFTTGRVSHAKTRAIARVADDGTEESLLDLARHTTAAQLERVVAAWRRSDETATGLARTAADTAAAAARATALAEGATETAADSAGQQAAAHVWVDWWPEGADRQQVTPSGPRERFGWQDRGDGTVVLTLVLPAETAAEVIASVEHRAEVLTRHDRVSRRVDPARPGPGERSPREVERARRERVTVARTTAFCDLVRAGAGAVESRPGDPARRELLVRVDAAVLADDVAAGQAALDGVAALSPSQARRLACDAAVTAVLVADGEVLACGRTRRHATRAQRRALLVRDGGCARPGCDETRAERLHAHHLRHWLHGGRTDVANLVLLCDRCHGLVHDLDLTLRRHRGRLVAHAPDGSPLWTTDQDPAPAVATAGTLAEAGLPPHWAANGERMDLGHVVGCVLGNRAQLRRRQGAQRAHDPRAEAA